MATSSIFTNVHITTKEGAEKFARALELAEQDGLWRPAPNFKAHFTTPEENEELMKRWNARHKQGAK